MSPAKLEIRMEHKEEEPKVTALGRAAHEIATTTYRVKKLVNEGYLEGVRLPGRVRLSGVTTASLNQLVANSRVGPQQEDVH